MLGALLYLRSPARMLELILGDEKEAVGAAPIIREQRIGQFLRRTTTCESGAALAAIAGAGAVPDNWDELLAAETLPDGYEAA